MFCETPLKSLIKKTYATWLTAGMLPSSYLLNPGEQRQSIWGKTHACLRHSPLPNETRFLPPNFPPETRGYLHLAILGTILHCYSRFTVGSIGLPTLRPEEIHLLGLLSQILSSPAIHGVDVERSILLESEVDKTAYGWMRTSFAPFGM